MFVYYSVCRYYWLNYILKARAWAQALGFLMLQAQPKPDSSPPVGWAGPGSNGPGLGGLWALGPAQHITSDASTRTTEHAPRPPLPPYPKQPIISPKRRARIQAPAAWMQTLATHLLPLLAQSSACPQQPYHLFSYTPPTPTTSNHHGPPPFRMARTNPSPGDLDPDNRVSRVLANGWCGICERYGRRCRP